MEKRFSAWTDGREWRITHPGVSAAPEPAPGKTLVTWTRWELEATGDRHVIATTEPDGAVVIAVMDASGVERMPLDEALARGTVRKARYGHGPDAHGASHDPEEEKPGAIEGIEYT